jgi:hypothetical protein
MRIIKVKFKIHRFIGITGFSFATIHAIYMISNIFF